MSNPACPPLSKEEAKLLPTWRAAYSDRTAALMAKLCQLAYADAAQIVAAVSLGGFELASVVAVGGLQAFLAINPARFAVLAFQGTADAQGWAFDLDARRVALPSHPDVDVHAGFWGAWSELAGEVTAAVNAHVPADLGLYITGHSLGGALAQIAAAELERDNLAACYTFGSPRVGTGGWDEHVKCPHYRVVDAWDLVPGVPLALCGFRHSGDPRLLVGQAPTAALRRDRGPIARFTVDLIDLLLGPERHQVVCVDDHMIWRYRAKLEAVAQARTPRT